MKRLQLLQLCGWAVLLSGCAKSPVQQVYDTSDDPRLTNAEWIAISNHIRPCWWAHHTARGGADTGFDMLPYAAYVLVTTDASGVVQKAVLAPQKLQAEMSPDGTNNEIYVAYGRFVISVLLDPRCSTLPLPPNMLGREHTFLFAVTP